jgi:hypothetical protein
MPVASFGIVLDAAKDLATRVGQVWRMRVAKTIDVHPISPYALATSAGAAYRLTRGRRRDPRRSPSGVEMDPSSLYAVGEAAP